MIQNNISLQPYNTFGIVATAKNFLTFTSTDEVIKYLPTIQEYGENTFVLGGGSNVLFCSDYQGLIIHPQTKGIEIISKTTTAVEVRVQAGEVWDDFVAWTVTNGLCGAENLSAIPGSVGASVVQNIGAYGIEAKDLALQVEVLDLKTGQISVLSNAQCQFAYRHSFFKTPQGKNLLVLSVVYKLSTEFVPQLSYAGMSDAVMALGECSLKNIRRAVLQLRNSKLPDPAKIGNAGSYFKNPIIPQTQADALQATHQNVPLYPASEGFKKVAAAWLIDQCGWKGRRVGSVGVHDKQALVLVNHGNAVGKDIADLAEEIRRSVFDRFSIDITPEVIYV